MAAVLCSGIGSLFTGCCEAFGKVVTLPFRACGFACNTFGDLVTSPFFPYLALTFGLNLPGFYFGMASIPSDCRELSSWLLGNGILCLIHMIAAMYIVNKIRATNSSSLNDKIVDSEAGGVTNYSNFVMPKENDQGAANSFSRIKHVLCYDTTMAVYIVIFIGWVIWLATGVAKRLGADEGGYCDSDIKGMNVAISLGYMYLSMVFVAFGCSLCCLR